MYTGIDAPVCLTRPCLDRIPAPRVEAGRLPSPGSETISMRGKPMKISGIQGFETTSRGIDGSMQKKRLGCAGSFMLITYHIAALAAATVCRRGRVPRRPACQNGARLSAAGRHQAWHYRQLPNDYSVHRLRYKTAYDIYYRRRGRLLFDIRIWLPKTPAVSLVRGAR
jgi:hypothetical protein